MKQLLFLFAGFLFLSSLSAQIVQLSKQKVVTTAAATPIAFRAAATYIGGEPVANNTEKKVDFTGVYFDENKNFSIATDEFIAPVTGIYHFDLRVGWLQFSAPGAVTLLLRTNLYQQIAVSSVQTSSTTQIFDSNFCTLLKLNAGDKVSVYVNQNSGAQQKFQQVVLSGFKVN